MIKKLLSGFSWLRDNWILSTGVIVIFGLATGALRLGLFSVPAGYSPAEIAGVERVIDYHPPWKYAVSAPYYAAVNLMELAIKDPVHAARAVSAIVGLLVLVGFFWIISLWFNKTMAILGVVSLASSSWFLHTARVGTDSILLVAAPLALFIFGTILVASKRKTFPAIVLSALSALALYVPYMIWLVVPSILIIATKNKALLSRIGKIPKLIGFSIFIVLVAPLVASLVLHPSQIRQLAGLPDSLPGTVQYLRNFLDLVASIGLRSSVNPALHLGKLPLLDIFSVVMMVMGLSYYSKRISLRRSLVLILCLLFSTLVIAFSGPQNGSIAIIMTPIYLLIVSGIFEVIKQWLSVFPRNPFARVFGVTMVVMTVAFASFYHLQNYYNAWPNAPETKSVYNSGL